MKITLLFIFITFSNFVAAETVHLTSLAWPPYSDKSLEQQGASVAVAKAAFKAEGHELIVDFYPWSRAVNSALQANSKYVGYFPEYMHETSDFIFSDATGTGPLGLVQNSAKPITFSSVNDLSGKRIGVVQDYVNTKELDDMIASGTIKGDAAPSDVLNIKKVAAGRIDAAVIDANVLKYLLATDKSLAGIKSKVAMNTTLLEDKKLYIAFRNDAEGQKWQTIYNQGLAKIDVNTIMANYLK
ncbi:MULTISPECIES: ABC transporter substrate-binding protein [Pseudoalteromonas]|jgi:polar amino acid transport system substrate-binding protein|uniref:ABC transporter n=1 Tax=Pseudoalteromonas aliena TaxID=247523 RepID=A0A1Q2GYT7_9GAMM|nr:MULTISPECIES: ABC transporter substrate-binding protein [Pseudoalteromonas]AQQ00181.1 ABC transporter [Pseudoalteromonas aliena]MBB1384317.1 ABC transporter substrate-binding protein [Pseudoalteromonas sp. SG45-5]MBB1393980.1 ABC transporter substrate-binding protein [Pseudoalteromonas sp. SG44-4]MBB1445774.1 ABC transporter substrate-binding protein [Pseudoalteromonas sp. SG41-6]TMO01898.1 ABC transporter [Pseudoalteromonas sp. S558]